MIYYNNRNIQNRFILKNGEDFFRVNFTVSIKYSKHMHARNKIFDSFKTPSASTVDFIRQ